MFLQSFQLIHPQLSQLASVPNLHMCVNRTQNLILTYKIFTVYIILTQFIFSSRWAESCTPVKRIQAELADDSQSVGQKTVCSRAWHWQHVFKTSLYFADWTKAKCDHLSLWWIKKKSLLICLKITVPLISLSHRQTFIQITFSLSLTVPPISQSLSLSHTHSSPDLPLTHTLRITVNLLVCQWSPWKN